MDWYYANGTERMGPIPEEEFRQRVNSGLIQPDTLVWRSGMPAWQPCREVWTAVPEADGVAATASAEAYEICSECQSRCAPSETVTYGDKHICIRCKDAFFQRLREGGESEALMKLTYASFGVRFAAKFVDGLILQAFDLVVRLATVGSLFETEIGLGATLGIATANMVFNIWYDTWFVGRFGATPGKMLFKLRIVRSDGGRVSYMRAFGRMWAEIPSALILGIGYLMAAFDEQRRALHDRMCDTRVVTRP